MFLQPLDGDEEVAENEAARDVPPARCDASTNARPLPETFIELPPTLTNVLAAHTAAVLSADLFAGPHSIAEGVIGLLPTPPSHGERGAVHLAVTFAASVMANLANRLLNDMEIHFGGIDMIQPTDILCFVCEHVESWRRRPTIPEDVPRVIVP